MTAALRIVSSSALETTPAVPSVAKAHQSGIAPRFDPHPIELALASHGLDLASFTFHATNVSDRPRGDAEGERDLSKAYACWGETYKALLEEVGRDSQMPSDEFTRQDEWAALHYGGDCIAVAGFRYLDFSRSYYADDSYFSLWPQEARDALLAIGAKVCVSSNFAVSRAWRGRLGELSVKDVMVALCVQHFNDSDSAVLVAAMRNARGMNLSTYRLGAKALATGVLHPKYGESIDLISFQKTPEDDRFPSSFTADLTRLIWRGHDIQELNDEAIAI